LPSTRNSLLPVIFATLIGAAIPSVVFGRAVFAAIAGLGFLALMASELRPIAWRHLIMQARTPLGILIIVTLVLWIFSSLGSSFPSRSLEASIRSGLFIAIGTLIYTGLQADARLYKLCLQAFTVVSMIAIVIAVIEITFLPEIYWALRLKGWISTPLKTELKGFSSLAVIMVPVLILVAHRCRMYWSATAAITMAGVGFLVWDISNRAAIAGFLCMPLAIALCQVLRYGARKRVLVIISGFAASLAIIIVWLRFTRGHLVAKAAGSDWLIPVWLVDFQRQTIWEHALGIASKAPWFGIGPNTINFAPGADRPLPGNESLHIIPAHPHNWVVEILTETGIIGLSLLLLVIFSATYRFTRRYRQTGNIAVLAAVAIMAGYWTSGLFNFSYWSAWWQVCFLIGVAISLAWNEESAISRSNAT
jgi:O-antigen ligase